MNGDLPVADVAGNRARRKRTAVQLRGARDLGSTVAHDVACSGTVGNSLVGEEDRVLEPQGIEQQLTHRLFVRLVAHDLEHPPGQAATGVVVVE